MKLSPAAQAVMKAAASAYWDEEEYEVAPPVVIAAAALRAVADQVVPEWAEPIMPEGQSEALILAHMERWGNWRRSSQARAEILAIAAELATDHSPSNTDTIAF